MRDCQQQKPHTMRKTQKIAIHSPTKPKKILLKDGKYGFGKDPSRKPYMSVWFVRHLYLLNVSEVKLVNSELYTFLTLYFLPSRWVVFKNETKYRKFRSK